MGVAHVPAQREVGRARGERQHQPQHEHHEVARRRRARRIRTTARDQLHQQPGADDRSEDEGHFLGGEREQHRRGDQEQPTTRALAEIAEHAVDPEHREQRHVHVHPHLAAVEQQRRRQRDQGRRAERRAPAEVGTEQPQHPHQRGAGQRGAQARGGVARAQEKEEQRVEVVEERTVVGRIVGVGPLAQQLVAVEGVDALVVRHHARAEVVDAERQGRR